LTGGIFHARKSAPGSAEPLFMIGRLTILTAVLAVAASIATSCLAAPAADATAQAAEAPAEAVTVYVTSGPTHSDIVIPRSAFADASPLMRKIVDDAKGGPWLIFGWGPFWFGRETEGGPYHELPVLWVNAMYTTFIPQLSTRLRVAALDEPGAAPLEPLTAIVAVKMTPDGLRRAIKRIEKTIETNRDGTPVPAALGGVAPGVMLYRSHEIYHVTHECNHWVSEVLHAGGVPDLTLFDLLPESLNADLEISGGTQVSIADPSKATPAASGSEASNAAEPSPR
jgi:hypothetical protein